MQPLVIPRSGHPVSRKDIDPHALKVLYRLYRAGFTSYLVGGGVRDLLLGIRPKDFDIATDAHPHQIRKLFRNCVLVGRRFRLAHVRFGSTVIEVSTFRRSPGEGEDEASGEDGLLIRRDNTFGTPEDDAVRRDFTVNAMFYDIGTFSIIDYVGGLRDLEDGFIRSIGDPLVRFEEDPVRMMRAVKLAARLGLEITDEDLEAIASRREAIELASVPRRLEEIYKILRGGASASSFKMLADTRLLEHLLPNVMAHLERVDAAADPENAAFYRTLFALDDAVRARQEGEPSNSFFLAALLLALVEEELADEGENHLWDVEPERLDAAVELAALPVTQALTVSRRDTERLRAVLSAQPVLAGTWPDDPAAKALQRRPFFHEAVDVLALGAARHGVLEDRAEAWREHAASVEPVRERRQVRRRRRGRRPAGGGQGQGAARGGRERRSGRRRR